MATIYDPIRIGNVVLKNRFAEAPTVKNFAKEDGRVNLRTLQNFELEADGPGLIIVTMSFTEPRGQVFARQIGVASDRHIPGLADLAERVHRAGAKIFQQIAHGGNLCSEGTIGVLPVGPSEKPQWEGQKVHALTTVEAEEIIENYGRAAARIKRAGLDGVELHACHGSLILQFMSPIHNIGRTDRFAVRPTFLYECVDAVRRYVGPDFPIGVRLSTHEFAMEDLGVPGLEADEVLNEVAPRLEAMGVDYIHASAGRIGHTPDHAFPPLYDPRGVNVHFAEEMKKRVHIPVVAIGRLQDPRLVEKIVAEGKADIVAMCRPIIAEPRFAKKMIEGRPEDVRQCMGCNYCLDRLFADVGTLCPMNPAYSWEAEYEPVPARAPRKVLVVGGGVGGLQTALIASLRGHDVTLYEKSDKLGGQTRLASAFPRLFTRELWNLPKWLIHELGKTKAKIILGTEVTPALVEKEAPDVLVIATGAKEKKFTLSSDSRIVYLWEYLDGKAVPGKNVVIIGGNEGAEAAVSLAREGKSVTLVEEGADIAQAAYIYPGAARIQPLMRYIKQENVKVLTNHKVVEVTKEGVLVKGPWAEELLPADSIVIAVGREPENALNDQLKGKAKEIYVIGDAKEPRSMVSASHEGHWVGRRI